MPSRFPLGSVLLAATTVFVIACGGGEEAPPEDLIDRTVFIDAYVDLRVAALNEDSGDITDAGRAEVLARYSIQEDDLLNFAEGHGRDLDFMRDVWNEVEQRLDVERPAEDPGQ